MQEVLPRIFRVAGRQLELAPVSVEERVLDSTPEPVRDHFVVVAGRRFPPKQVLALLTGLDRSDFTTGQARSIFRRLGFATGRITASTSSSPGGPGPAPTARTGEPADLVAEADELRPYRGRWVAMEGRSVVASGDSPQEVLAWLRRYDRRVTGGMFRVPFDPTVDLGGFAS